MNFSHPLWLVGFRPFFTLAMLAGIVLPLLWAVVFSGVMAPAPAPFSLFQWHAHEMFFGFGWAVMGGFLLTASKNWVNVRGYHGWPLAALALAWGVERLVLWFAGSLPDRALYLGSQLFLLGIVLMLLWTLLRYRHQDGYPISNLFFLVMLPAFLVAKWLLLFGAEPAAGYGMTLGLFRLAFLVMLERTLTQFMQGVFQVSILRNPLLDGAIKVLGLLCVFAYWLPPVAGAALTLTLAALLLIRFCFWHPHQAMRRLDLCIMFLGYLALCAQLLLEGWGRLYGPAGVGSLSTHTFTFGVMGLIIPAMLIRICNGHTGRKVVFDARDKAVLWLMIAAAVARLVLTQAWPLLYPRWIEVSALLWAAAFALLAWRYIPYLWQPRVDGKLH